MNMMTILQHNEQFRSDMTIAEVIDWVDEHAKLLEHYDLISCEERGGGIKSTEQKPIS